MGGDGALNCTVRWPCGSKAGHRRTGPKGWWWACSSNSVAALPVAGPPPEGSQWIYVADRESDIYEVLQSCQRHGVDFVIRAGQDRRLAEEAGRLRIALAQAPVPGPSTVEVRDRGGQPARTAIVQLRGVQVHLDGPWRPGRRTRAAPERGRDRSPGSGHAGRRDGTAALDFAHHLSRRDPG